MKTNQQRKDELEDLQDLINKIETGMLTTVLRNGELKSRPMHTVEMAYDGSLYFFTNEFSPKVEEILQHAHVNVAYADNDSSKYVSVNGEASIVTDSGKIEELWNPMLKAWFPDGLADPKLSLLKVSIDSAEYWDGSSSKVVQAFKIGKALISGQQYDVDDDAHGKITN